MECMLMIIGAGFFKAACYVYLQYQMHFTGAYTNTHFPWAVSYSHLRYNQIKMC